MFGYFPILSSISPLSIIWYQCKPGISFSSSASPSSSAFSSYLSPSLFLSFSIRANAWYVFYLPFFYFSIYFFFYFNNPLSLVFFYLLISNLLFFLLFYFFHCPFSLFFIYACLLIYSRCLFRSPIKGNLQLLSSFSLLLTLFCLFSY